MVKRFFLFVMLSVAAMGASAQSCWWVYLTDKAGTTFDPYSYFDAKAIERYQLNGADLYDISNYPLNEGYVASVDELATEEVGTSRWFNAVAVMATDEQIAAIEALPCVREVRLIASEMRIAACAGMAEENSCSGFPATASPKGALPDSVLMTDQLLRMGGDLFRKAGIDGKGVRVAIFDGGFPNVDKHDAFRHLRDNGLIIATWDFTKKRENVYYSGTHGTMTLSCITGVVGSKQLGLATGSSFLLAKTEVEPEPYKEEVWWTQAMEWADKNGADVINSSLGYGKDRHYTYEMDGRSHVAKAANMAARKGMLVCNSAGNEGSDRKWKTIITPADADSVITVGGIESSLTCYRHISFSSYGPTADRRQKPNVVNFGHALCADPHELNETEWAYGTSFSSPLTAGFVACAWQTHRNLTAMELKAEIEKSADLYPYCDYAFGYGVPQAAYFMNQTKKTDPTFEFTEMADAPNYILVHPLNVRKMQRRQKMESSLLESGDQETPTHTIFLKLVNSNGIIEEYMSTEMEELTTNMYLAVPKAAIRDRALMVHYDGTTQTYSLSAKDKARYLNDYKDFNVLLVDTGGYIVDPDPSYLHRDIGANKTSSWGVGQKWLFEWGCQLGTNWFFPYTDMRFDVNAHMAVRVIRNFRKWYSWGMGLEFGTENFDYDPQGAANVWDANLGLAANANTDEKLFTFADLNLELFQRIRFMAGGLHSKGLHWDVGAYGGIKSSTYKIVYRYQNLANSKEEEDVHYYYGMKPAADNIWQWGLTTRLTYDWFGVYARYRMSQPTLDLPRLELGLQVTF